MYVTVDPEILGGLPLALASGGVPQSAAGSVIGGKETERVITTGSGDPGMRFSKNEMECEQ